jgi:hypothetical protein
MPSGWMPNVIIVDNAQGKINVLKFDMSLPTSQHMVIDQQCTWMFISYSIHFVIIWGIISKILLMFANHLHSL